MPDMRHGYQKVGKEPDYSTYSTTCTGSLLSCIQVRLWGKSGGGGGATLHIAYYSIIIVRNLTNAKLLGFFCVFLNS